MIMTAIVAMVPKDEPIKMDIREAKKKPVGKKNSARIKRKPYIIKVGIVPLAIQTPITEPIIIKIKIAPKPLAIPLIMSC